MNQEKDTTQKDKEALSGNDKGSQHTLLSKAEKLTTAIYMVTSFMPINEPIKDKLRLVNLGVISDISKAGFGRTGKGIIAAIREATSLLNIALAMDLISPMNYSILNKEYSELLRRIDLTPGLFKDISLPLVLGDSFFTEAELLLTATAETPSYKGQSIKDKEKMSLISIGHSIGKDKGQKMVTENKGAPKIGRKSSRREEILKIVRKMNKVTINDISTSLPGYGGKTIQRDLFSLVAQGILKKEGEKRWSKYFLA